MIEKWLELINRIMQLIAAFQLGESVGAKRANDAEKAALKSEVELEQERRQRALEEANSVFSDRDIIRRAIKRGRKLLGMPD